MSELRRSKRLKTKHSSSQIPTPPPSSPDAQVEKTKALSSESVATLATIPVPRPKNVFPSEVWERILSFLVPHHSHVYIFHEFPEFSSEARTLVKRSPHSSAALDKFAFRNYEKGRGYRLASLDKWAKDCLGEKFSNAYRQHDLIRSCQDIRESSNVQESGSIRESSNIRQFSELLTTCLNEVLKTNTYYIFNHKHLTSLQRPRSMSSVFDRSMIRKLVLYLSPSYNNRRDSEKWDKYCRCYDYSLCNDAKAIYDTCKVLEDMPSLTSLEITLNTEEAETGFHLHETQLHTMQAVLMHSVQLTRAFAKSYNDISFTDGVEVEDKQEVHFPRVLVDFKTATRKHGDWRGHHRGYGGVTHPNHPPADIQNLEVMDQDWLKIKNNCVHDSSSKWPYVLRKNDQKRFNDMDSGPIDNDMNYDDLWRTAWGNGVDTYGEDPAFKSEHKHCGHRSKFLCWKRTLDIPGWQDEFKAFFGKTVAYADSETPFIWINIGLGRVFRADLPPEPRVGSGCHYATWYEPAAATRIL